KPGDVIKIRGNKQGKGLWQNISEALAKKEVPSWISLQAADLSAKITSVPSGAELQQPFDTKLIIEFYSR
ncbi:MAG: small subunit ribosomal protein, partial [Patescibacteria group bacterium]|nr:small subunit ribosomal protein [Patescibacteria group bacterium]